jgi:hypothetical protein
MRPRSLSITIRPVHAQAVHTKGNDVKKTIAAAALLISLVAVGCSNNSATPAPASEAPAAVESIAAGAEEAAESVAAEVEGAAESVAAEVEDAVESLAAEASPAA